MSCLDRDSERDSGDASDGSSATWTAVCRLDAILPESGVCALIGGRQVAVFRAGDRAYAVANVDPFTRAPVLSRGLVTSRGGILAVASPLHKQRFALATGECLDAADQRIDTWPCRIEQGVIEVALGPAAA